MAVVLATMLAACSNQHQAESVAEADDSAETSAAAPAAKTDAQSPAGEQPMQSRPTAQQMVSAAVQDDGTRRFIRTAQVQFRTRDVYRTAMTLEDRVAALGGFVTDNDITGDVERTQTQPDGAGHLIDLETYTVRGTLTVRVPTDRLQGFLRALADQMDVLVNRRYEARDAQFELLRQQLAQQRAQATQQALAANAQQAGKQGERTQTLIEQANQQAARDEARLAQKEYEDRIAFATVQLSFYQAPQVRQRVRADVDSIARHAGPGFFVQAAHGVRAGWDSLLQVLVWVVRLWPLWLVAGAVLLWRRRLRVPR